MKLRTTLLVLERKHAALLKLAKDAEAVAAARRRDVEHVAETIRLLTQDVRSDLTTAHRRKAPITTSLLAVLRRAQKPLELAEIMAAYAAEVSEAAILQDVSSRSRLETSIKATLATLRNRGLVHPVGGSLGMWEISVGRRGVTDDGVDDSCPENNP